MSGSTGRTKACDPGDARERLTRAREFLSVAVLVAGEHLDDDDLNLSGVAASLAVLAGIAASDAVCCTILGRRSRGSDHRHAVHLLQAVTRIGPDMAKDLDRLLALKDNAHYGILGLSDGDADRAVRWAGRMVDAATTAVIDRPEG